MKIVRRILSLFSAHQPAAMPTLPRIAPASYTSRRELRRRQFEERNRRFQERRNQLPRTRSFYDVEARSW